MGQIHAALWGLALVVSSPGLLFAAKPHIVALGAMKKVPYSTAGDPAGAAADEKELRVRPLVIDAKIKEWTTGDAHDVTDRSFAVRRAIRLNDALPTEKNEHWVWQRGPWLLVDRVTGHIAAIKLPDYDPAVSSVVWFRDFAAYCGPHCHESPTLCRGGAGSCAQARAGQEAWRVGSGRSSKTSMCSFYMAA